MMKTNLRVFVFGIFILAVCFFDANECAAFDSPVTAIQFTPDGNSVLASSQNGISVYHWPELSLKETFKVSFSNVHDLKFSPDGSRLAIAGGEPGETGELNIWNWPQKSMPRKIERHSDSIYSLSWTSDSKQVATVSLDGQALLGVSKIEKAPRQFSGHSKGVTGCCLLVDDSILVTAGIDQSLRVWETKTGQLLRTMNNHSGPIHAIKARPNHEGLPMVVSVASDRTIRFWQPTIGRMVRFVKIDAIPLDVVWHPTQPVVAATTSTGAVISVDIETAEVLQKIDTGSPWSYSLAISPDGKWIVVPKPQGLKKIRLK